MPVALAVLTMSPLPSLTLLGCEVVEAVVLVTADVAAWSEAAPLPLTAPDSRALSDSAVTRDGTLTLGGVLSTLRMRNLV